MRNSLQYYHGDNRKTRTNKFFVCPYCGNVEKFKIFTSSFQVIKQSQERGICVDKSGVLPNLRQNDNYVECQKCFKKSEYEAAMDLGKKFIEHTRSFSMVNVPATVKIWSKQEQRDVRHGL